MNGATPVTIETLVLIFGFSGILWALFSVYRRVDGDLREQRIMLNIICNRLGIDPAEILGGKDK